jgi:hypothetical protein
MRGQDSLIRPSSPSPNPELLKTAYRMLSLILAKNSRPESAAATLDFDEFRQAVRCERSPSLRCCSPVYPENSHKHSQVLQAMRPVRLY